MTEPVNDHPKVGDLHRPTVRRRALFLLPIIVGVHLWLDLVYRDWVKAFGWNDWGLADSFTQITAILGIACLMVLREWRDSVPEPPPQIFFFLVPVLAMAGYEVLQIWLPATFDRQDLIYCLIGAAINGLILKTIVFRKTKPRCSADA